MDNKQINVLCFDGGGVRGLSSLLILKSLMEQLKIKSDSKKDLRPCQVFDMICGTSTGGLTAIMLGRLRMDIDDAIKSYMDFSKSVFENSGNASKSSSCWNIFSQPKKIESSPAKYDAAKLEKWVKDIISKHGNDAQASLKDPLANEGDFCRTFVVAQRESHVDAPPALFRTYSTSTMDADMCKIWQAVRATTAALPFFDSVTFGDPPVTYIDGSFSGSNNPSQLAINEVRDIFPSRKIGCFLSLGTGVLDPTSVTDNIATAYVKLVQSCKGVHEEVGKNFSKGSVDAHARSYFRFSVDRGVGKIGIDDWKRYSELTGITIGYMRYNEQEEKAKKCVETLNLKAKEIVEFEAESLQ